MIDKIIGYIAENHLFTKNDRILVAVSGGIDSVVLLHILKRLGYRCVVAHCNFHLRGEESDGDAAFVSQMAKNLNVDFFKTDFDTYCYAKEHNMSIEMAARDLRYEWFEKIRVNENCAYIAVAHHADDSIETFFLNLTRGTGLRGLVGIRPKNGYVVRPMLFCFRSEIEAYAKEQGLSFHFDSSNDDKTYKRNAVRHQIIPQFKVLNPAFSNTMVSNMNRFANIYDIYKKYINSQISELIYKEKGDVFISIEKLKKTDFPNIILYEMLHPYGFKGEIVEAICQHLDAESGTCFFSHSHRLVKDRDFLLVCEQTSKGNQSFEINKGVNRLEEPVPLSFDYYESEAFSIQKKTSVACLDADKIDFPFTLRHWCEGDWFIPFGMKGRKRLSDYFINRKYSLLEKEKVWILTDACGSIVWIVNDRIDDRFKVTFKTKRVLVVKYGF